MLNMVTIVGRLVKDPQLEQIGDSEFAKIVVACPRPYKNSEGVYDTDFIDVILKGGVATNTVEYCRKGDIVGVKARIENGINSDEYPNARTQIVAEKITFLASKNANNNGNSNENCNNNDLERDEI